MYIKIVFEEFRWFPPGWLIILNIIISVDYCRTANIYANLYFYENDEKGGTLDGRVFLHFQISHKYIIYK